MKRAWMPAHLLLLALAHVPAALCQQVPLDNLASEPAADGGAQPELPKGTGDTLPVEAAPVDGVPPGFEKVLPQETLDKLKALHANTNLTFPQKRREFDRIMNSVAKSVLVKLPLPPGFETLPAEVQAAVRQVHEDSTLSWNEKHRRIGKIIDALPSDQRARLPARPASLLRGARRPNFPPAPPPGFERVLPSDVYAELLTIHQDALLTPKEKIQRIDAIMRSLPQDVLDRLPLPPGFDQLPEEQLKQARAIFASKDLAYEEKNKAVIRFVKTLTPEQRQLVRPPLPPGLSNLPQEIKDQIDSIFEDETLDEEERHTAFWKLVATLPHPHRAKIEEDLGEDRE